MTSDLRRFIEHRPTFVIVTVKKLDISSSGCLYSIVTVVGVLSNGLVISVIYRQPSMRTVTNYFLANLATADVLVCVFVLPVTLLQNIYTGKSNLG